MGCLSVTEHQNVNRSEPLIAEACRAALQQPVTRSDWPSYRFRPVPTSILAETIVSIKRYSGGALEVTLVGLWLSGDLITGCALILYSAFLETVPSEATPLVSYLAPKTRSRDDATNNSRERWPVRCLGRP